MCPQLLHHLRCVLMFFLFLFCLLKVKIWFQNKRSKYKKIMKHGSSGPEGDMLHTTSSSSPCSPGLSQLWEVSMANKVPPMHPSSYMNNYGHWYPPHHQDPLPRPQMMWLKAGKQSQRDSIPYWHLPNLWWCFPLQCPSCVLLLGVFERTVFYSLCKQITHITLQ